METPQPADRVLADFGLAECRMAMLGVDPQEVRSADPDMYFDVVGECACCDMRRACTADLRRDPNSPVWESYCPNNQTFIALAREIW
jgi:hypothetical protein